MTACLCHINLGIFFCFQFRVLTEPPTFFGGMSTIPKTRKRKNSQGCNAVIQEACVSRNIVRTKSNEHAQHETWMDAPQQVSAKASKIWRNSHTWWGPCWKADVLTFCDDWGKMRRSELLTDSPSRCLPLTSESAGACSSAGGWAGGWMAGGSFS